MEKEKEISVPKPADLFIGVVDFFAILVPGVIAAAIIAEVLGRHLGQASNFFLAGLITVGWVFGHGLNGIGSWLDFLLYDPLFKLQDSAPVEKNPQSCADCEAAKKTAAAWSSRFPKPLGKYFHANDRRYRLASEMTHYPDKHSAGHTEVPGGMYQWARVWLNSHNPESATNLNRHEADSKLFRSLAVFFLIALFLLVGIALSPGVMAAVIPTAGPNWLQTVPDHKAAWIIFVTAGMIFSLWRYCDLRHKMIRQCYLAYVQLHSAPVR